MIAREQLLSERSRHEAAIGVINDLLTRFGEPAEHEPPPPKRKVQPAAIRARKAVDRDEPPAPVPAKASAPGMGKMQAHERRVTLARLLVEGPMQYMRLAENSGIPTGSVWAVLQHEWFEKRDDGDYELTTKGRLALTDIKD